MIKGFGFTKLLFNKFGWEKIGKDVRKIAIGEIRTDLGERSQKICENKTRRVMMLMPHAARAAGAVDLARRSRDATPAGAVDLEPRPPHMSCMQNTAAQPMATGAATSAVIR